MTRVAVAGGTGVVGRYVVAALTEAGHEPVVLARSAGVDLTTGRGLDEALVGVAAVVDVCNVATTKRSAAAAFFSATTTKLLAAGQRAGVAHHVVLSIVGIDRVKFGYYEGKQRQEELVLDGPVPASVLRATQFHEFAGQILDRSRGPVAVIPKMRVQPIAATEVADALVALALASPVGMAAELAGPQPEDLPDLARQVVRARGQRRRVLSVRLPGAAGRAMVEGGLLPTEPGRRRGQTFAQWLAGHDVREPGRT
jgi:uncharacterized protein YbjT (DUF2867 family)